MTKPELPVTNGTVANGAFGIFLILAILWLAGGISAGFFTGDWNFIVMFVPLFAVVLLQMLFTWLGATIKSHVAQGVVLGLAQHEIQEQMRKIRNSAN
jgi:hypothetical protein